ncbi:hypothetical protein Tco_0377093 [Tanacetum coccineum]
MSPSLSSNVPDNSPEQEAATGPSILTRLDSSTSQAIQLPELGLTLTPTTGRELSHEINNHSASILISQAPGPSRRRSRSPSSPFYPDATTFSDRKPASETSELNPKDVTARLEDVEIRVDDAENRLWRGKRIKSERVEIEKEREERRIWKKRKKKKKKITRKEVEDSRKEKEEEEVKEEEEWRRSRKGEKENEKKKKEVKQNRKKKIKIEQRTVEKWNRRYMEIVDSGDEREERSEEEFRDYVEESVMEKRINEDSEVNSIEKLSGKKETTARSLEGIGPHPTDTQDHKYKNEAIYELGCGKEELRSKRGEKAGKKNEDRRRRTEEKTHIIRTPRKVTKAVECLKKEFEMKDLGKTIFVLDCKLNISMMGF